MTRKVFTPLILIFTEGKYDKLLIQQLQRVYGTHFSMRQGNGSSPELILRDCLKENGSFDIRYCVLDGDIIADLEKFKASVKIENEKLAYELVTVITCPCMEAVDMALLFGDISGFSKKKCGALKKQVAEKMGNLDRESYYEQYLTKSLINENYYLFENQEFKIIIDLFRTKNL